MSVAFVREVVAEALGIAERKVEAVLELVAEGGTVPFIARYRKERTGGLDEVQIRGIIERADAARALVARKEVVKERLVELGKWTDEHAAFVGACKDLGALEDFYLPFRPRRRSRATEAEERGLAPLAERILEQPESGHPRREAQAFVAPDRGVEDVDAALSGARDIIVERVVLDGEARATLREAFLRAGEVAAKKTTDWRSKKTPFDALEGGVESIGRLQHHRFLALRRGENEKVLSLSWRLDQERTLNYLGRRHGWNRRSPFADELWRALEEAWTGRLKRNVVSEVKKELGDRAEDDAARVFARNLRHLLLESPFGARTTLGIDPGFQSGCKCAVVDAGGQVRETRTIQPHRGASARSDAGLQLLEMVRGHDVDAIAIGNGTAGRETESFVRELVGGKDAPIVVSISEAGASVYSASDLAREEFPDLDLTLRGAISIARRLQDPLAELVKVPPESLGVGQYQHDVDDAKLENSLHAVVESCVNEVGVELNTSSAALLEHVSGLGKEMSRRIVTHRETSGPFASRKALLDVKGLGAKTYRVAAGFLRVAESDEVLDHSAVHPERYALVRRMAQDLGVGVEQMIGSEEFLPRIDLERYCDDEVGLPTLEDILAELERPGRDPRDAFEPPRFADLSSIDDLEAGMELEGVVTNVTAFGAFVDLGIKTEGLIHKSAFGRRVNDPSEVAHPRQRVLVRVQQVDRERGRIGLELVRERQPPGHEEAHKGRR